MNLSLVAAIAAVTLTAYIPQATAQQGESEINATLIACKSIADPMQRLACMDAATDALAAISLAREGMTAKQQEEQLRNQFGFADRPEENQERLSTLETEAEFGSETLPEAIKQRENRKLKSITTTITNLKADPYGKVTITLENGQTWRQLSSDSKKLNVPRSSGKRYTAEIKRSALGGYKMTITEMHRTIRVRRIK